MCSLFVFSSSVDIPNIFVTSNIQKTTDNADTVRDMQGVGMLRLTPQIAWFVKDAFVLKVICIKCSNGFRCMYIIGIATLACDFMPFFNQPRTIYQAHHYIDYRACGIKNEELILSHAQDKALLRPIVSRITPCGCKPWKYTWVLQFGQSPPNAMLMILACHKHLCVKIKQYHWVSFLQRISAWSICFVWQS